MSVDWKLDLFTIYERPVDLPEAVFAVRRFEVGRGSDPQVCELVGTADGLDEARALVPSHAGVRIPRSLEDEPQIVETWI